MECWDTRIQTLGATVYNRKVSLVTEVPAIILTAQMPCRD